MTLPLQALANNPWYEDPKQVPTWRKSQAQIAQQQAQQQQEASSPYSASAQMQDPQAQQNTLSSIDQMSQSALQGAQQGALVRQQRNQQYTQDLFQYNQTVAQQKFQADTTAQLKQMQKDYTDKLNAIPQNQQYGPYNGPNLANNFQGPGTTGSGPVQYTGNASQVAQMARNAGFPESAIPTVVAISQAESSGKADATHLNADQYGSTDLGLMQINDHWHADLLKQYNWQDPQQNMDMAYQVYKDAGGSFTPWSTYNGGQYQKYLGMGQTAASAVQPAVDMNPFAVQTTSGLRQAIISKAETYIGLPYVWGGTDLSKGVDCSGLVQQVYKQFGINLPRVSAEQSLGSESGYKSWGVRTSISHLEPGDLVYFYHSDGQVHHIAVWLGDNQILEAPHTGANVRIRTLSDKDKPNGLHLYGLDPSQPSVQQGSAKPGAGKAV